MVVFVVALVVVNAVNCEGEMVTASVSLTRSHVFGLCGVVALLVIIKEGYRLPSSRVQ